MIGGINYHTFFCLFLSYFNYISASDILIFNDVISAYLFVLYLAKISYNYLVFSATVWICSGLLMIYV